MVEAAAAGLGHTLRVLWIVGAWVVGILPQLVGALAILYGVWLFDYRAAIILGGVGVLLSGSPPRQRPEVRK